ncbi:uncharacterized protein BcabD6B2_42280 [Babesia caballi]|uniref:Uncharacterized protein n=1 Tax=Babesia caballi TaxID=5871 RepID=A0AAV4LXR1_BABCB|nr:hypothetical protein, conserved [Babesia caballi]
MGRFRVVLNLLQGVEESESKLSAEFTKVKQALNTDSGSSLITKLAEGLQQFVGYEGGMLSNTTPKLTGGGILPANVAKYQVCNAVLNFVIRFLEGLLGINGLESLNKEDVKTVIVKLRKCVGTGQVPRGFGTLVEGIGNKVDSIGKKVLKNTQGKLKEVFDEFKKVSDKCTGHDVSGPKVEGNELDKFLNAVDLTLHSNNSVYFKTYCEKLGELLKNDEFKNNANKDGPALSYGLLQTNITGVTAATTNLNNEIRNINNTPGKANLIPNAAVFSAVRDAATAFIAEIKEPTKYTSHYDKHKNPEADWGRVNGNPTALQMCAKIFLGCLPLYYQALTYIYWGCHEKGGGWGNQTLANGAMRSHFDSQGLLPIFVESSRTGAHIADSALNKFSEFVTAASPPLSSSAFTYASFAAELQKKVGENVGHLPTECPLSALYHGASCYFRCQQITTTKSAGGTPKTIREMLYFLAALPFSLSYEGLIGHIDNVLNYPMYVADSGTSHPNNTLSAADVKSYITSTFHLAPAFIGLIQEPSTSSDPWLHRLYFNTHFDLNFPSSPSALFNALSNYAYALQFQLGFLYQQCSQLYVNICGWFMCTFGKDVNTTLTHRVVPSHICSVGCTTGAHNNSDDITKHKTYCEHADCGKSNNKSPLQAFLTDNLKGFSRGHPSDPSSHLASCSGSLCHVPMGFESHLRDGSVQGGNISLTLKPYCGSHNAPLRQLCGTLTCLSKRAPRSLGDLFGFYWQVTGQLSKTLGSLHSAQWFSDLVGHTPFSSTVKDNINVLKTFVGTGHDSHTDSRMDLSNLHLSIQQNHRACYGTGKTCGPYLYPFTVSNGATFGKPAPYASVYLSWIVYLTDDLQTGFQELLDEFKNIDCKATGCRGKAGSQQACISHAPGTHGTSNECKCDSVVHCGGVLPLLYRHGFQFHDAYSLNDTTTKRNCAKFSQQLSNVLAENAPFAKLLESTDSFLYMFRYHLFYNLSSFWLCFLAILLYFIFYGIDVVHVKSHGHFPSSHTVPPIGLLTTGKAPALTKLTYYTP